MSHDHLATDVQTTLRSVIHAPRPNPNGFFVRNGLWQRSNLVTPDYHERWLHPIYVDGLYGACRWNSWKVHDVAIEDGLSVWMGYAFGGSRWTEHTWCMLGGRIVETTAMFRIYYGTKLNPSDMDEFHTMHHKLNLESREGMQLWTSNYGRRHVVPYDPAIHASTIGRERNRNTGEVSEGLGRE